MPDPGSHAYDVQRTRLRAQHDDAAAEFAVLCEDRDAGDAVQWLAVAEGHVVARGTLVGVVAR